MADRKDLGEVRDFRSVSRNQTWDKDGVHNVKEKPRNRGAIAAS